MTLQEMYAASKHGCGRRGLPRAVVDAIHQDYLRLKSCAKVAALWGSTRQGIHELLQRRNATRPRRLHEERVRHNGEHYTPGKNGYLRRTRRSGHAELQLHRVIWTEHHGPIPQGHEVVFKDGDKRNVTLENLECLTVGEGGRRTSKGENGATKARKLDLVASVERYIVWQAGIIAAAYHVEASDLAQAGRLHALRAAEKYDAAFGAKFLTYCGRGISEAMRREAADVASVVSGPRAKYRRGEFGSTSLDAPVGRDGELTLGEVIAAPECGARVESGEAEALRAAMEALEPRLRRVIEARFVDGRSLVDVAADIDISRARVWQLEQMALHKLRCALRRRGVDSVS